MYKYAIDDYFKRKEEQIKRQEEEEKKDESEIVKPDSRTSRFLSNICSLEFFAQILLLLLLFVIFFYLNKDTSFFKEFVLPHFGPSAK
jgi:hypothetical protein